MVKGTVAIDFQSIFFMHTTEVNVYHQLFGYSHSSVMTEFPLTELSLY